MQLFFFLATSEVACVCAYLLVKKWLDELYDVKNKFLSSHIWLTQGKTRDKIGPQWLQLPHQLRNNWISSFKSGYFHSAHHLQSAWLCSSLLLSLTFTLASTAPFHFHHRSRELSSHCVSAADEMLSNQADDVCDAITILVFVAYVSSSHQSSISLRSALPACQLLRSFPVAHWLRVLSFGFRQMHPKQPGHPFTSCKCVPPVRFFATTALSLFRTLGDLLGPTLLLGNYVHWSFWKPFGNAKCSCDGKDSGFQLVNEVKRSGGAAHRGREGRLLLLADLRCWHLIPLSLMKLGSLLLVKVTRVNHKVKPKCWCKHDVAAHTGSLPTSLISF